MNITISECPACGYKETYHLPPMLSLRDFCGEEHYKWARQQYDEARRYLKNCGKPKDEYERWLIKFYKETETIFQRYK